MQACTYFLCFGFFRLNTAYLMNCAFNGSIASFQYLAGLFFRFCKNFPALHAEIIGIGFIISKSLLKFFLLLAYGHTFVFPIPAVPRNIQQVAVHIDIITAHKLLCHGYYVVRQTNLSGNLNSKRTSGSADRQPKQRFHALAVIQHRAIDKPIRLFGKLL